MAEISGGSIIQRGKECPAQTRDLKHKLKLHALTQHKSVPRYEGLYVGS